MVKAKAANFNGPSKPPTGFMLYMNEVRTKVTADLRAKVGDGFKIAMVAAEVGKMWKEVPEERKTELNAKSKELKEKYDVELAAWKKTPEFMEFSRSKANETQKKENKANAKEAKESGMPLKPMAPYMMYSIEQTPAVIAKLKAETGKADMKARAAIIKGQWDALPQATKDEYEAKYKANKAQYAIDIEAWNQTEAGIKFSATKNKNAAKAKKAKETAKQANKSPRATKKRKLEDGSAEPQPEESPVDDVAESEDSPAESDESPEE